jgi:PTS system mannitol-specific IIC component
VATPSPGSIFAYFAVTPRGGYFGVIAGIVIAAGVSFLTGFGILRMSKEVPVDVEEQSAATPPPMTAAPQGA